MAGFRTVADYRAALTPQQLEMVDTLRELASAAAPNITERIKWNAPSFAIDDDDRITLGTDPKTGAIRVILHRGVKPKDATGFSFAAPADLVKWAAPDRGVMTFASPEALRARAGEVGEIFRRWLECQA